MFQLNRKTSFDPYSLSNDKKKNLNKFVDHTRLKKINSTNLGFEHDRDVADDRDFYRKIFETHSYNAGWTNTLDLFPNLSERRSLSDNRVEEFAGLDRELIDAVESLMNNCALAENKNIFNKDKEVETTFYKFVSKKLGKKVLKNKEGFSREDFYLIRLQWLLKVVKAQTQMQKHNLNSLRIIIEKLIKEVSSAFQIHWFKQQKKVTKILRKFSIFISKLEPQKAILLSYKLFKMHLKQQDIEDPLCRYEIANKLHEVFLPYINLMEIKEIYKSQKVQKKRTHLVTYKKIKKFCEKPDVIQILSEYPDPTKCDQYVDAFLDFLSEKVCLNKVLSELAETQRSELIREYSKTSLPEEQQVFEKPEDFKVIQNFERQNFEQPKSSEILRKSDFSTENTDFHDVDEMNTIKPINIYNYDFGKIKASKLDKDSSRKQSSRGQENMPPEITIAKKGSSKEEENQSDDSSSEEQGDDQGTEKELLEDPELYEPEEIKVPDGHGHMKKSRLVLEEKDLVFGDRSFRLSPDMRRSHPEINLMGSSLSNGKHINGKKEPCMTSDDVNIKSDPIRLEHKPDLIRLNSFGDLSSSRIQREREEDEEDAAEKMEESLRLSVRKRTSVCQNNLPMNKTKKEIIYQKILNIAYDNVSKWDRVIDNSTVKIEKIKPENSPVLLIRAWACIEGFTPNEIFEQIYDTEKRAKWDSVVAGLRIVEAIDENCQIIHFYIKTPFGITERDFLQRRDFMLDYPEKGHIVMSFQSCAHPMVPPTKNRIRGETHVAGYIMKPSASKPNSTDFCILSQVDIKGKVPTAIVNMVAAKAPAEWLNKLRKACEKARLGRL